MIILEVLFMVVTFCGHKEIADSAGLRDRLLSVLHALILEGADSFLLGGYGAFDTAVPAYDGYEKGERR